MTTTSGFDSARHPRARSGPGGGQFITTPRDESADVSLAPDNHHTSGFTHDQIDALGVEIDTLNQDEQRVMRILLDPDLAMDLGFDDDPESLLAEYEDFDGNDLYDITKIADRTAAQYHGTSYALQTSYPDSSEWEYVVSQDCGPDIGRLSQSDDVKRLNADRILGAKGHTGLCKAVAVAAYLDQDLRTVRDRALAAGLIDTPEAPEGS
ncbi:hypothetical protein [Nocardioides sp. Leaf285]|uniref:hypothetical protein n=1 Tax=Nocardioides sp. Leaf285 TaxID=1736322 RepID=UPI0007027AF5|nr:hypothetical protein [Nocardioides sp. Leaf285]KQP63134.1 hypothetical protein ASF47_19180 [Nocardioides sp. Leaf285]